MWILNKNEKSEKLVIKKSHVKLKITYKKLKCENRYEKWIMEKNHMKMNNVGKKSKNETKNKWKNELFEKCTQKSHEKNYTWKF